MLAIEQPYRRRPDPTIGIAKHEREVVAHDPILEALVAVALELDVLHLVRSQARDEVGVDRRGGHIEARVTDVLRHERDLVRELGRIEDVQEATDDLGLGTSQGAEDAIGMSHGGDHRRPRASADLHKKRADFLDTESSPRWRHELFAGGRHLVAACVSEASKVSSLVSRERPCPAGWTPVSSRLDMDRRLRRARASPRERGSTRRGSPHACA